MKIVPGADVAMRYGAWALRCKIAAALMLLATPAMAQEDAVRIVALGDSLTHGYGLPPQEGFVPQLEAWLHENGAPWVDVINAGVSGDTTAGGLARLEWSLSDTADALIVVLGGNDLLRGIDPAASRANLEAIMQGAETRSLPVLISGMRAPGNYGPEYKEAFDAMYPDLAAAYDALYDPFFLEGVDNDRSLWQPDGIHPNAEGVAVIVERIGPMVLELAQRARQDA